MKIVGKDALVIENIVSSGTIADSVNLGLISGIIPDCTFSREKFPGAVLHMQDPKSVALIFSSGKIVLTGLVRHEDIATALHNVVILLKKAGIPCRDDSSVSVKNIVCTYNLNKPCNLTKIMIALLDHERVEYEPECFPGLVCRISDPKIVFLIFSSGKIVITGGLNIEDVKRGLEVLREKLRIVGNMELEN